MRCVGAALPLQRFAAEHANIYRKLGDPGPAYDTLGRRAAIAAMVDDRAVAEQGGLENSAAMMQAALLELAVLERDAHAAVAMGQKALGCLHRPGMTSARSLTAA